MVYPIVPSLEHPQDEQRTTRSIPLLDLPQVTVFPGREGRFP